jgi:soluble lytic murein transglycosylase-like protein
MNFGPIAIIAVAGLGFLAFTAMQGEGFLSIAEYARNAGFQGIDLVTATAIALAESSGNPKAYNPEKAAGAPEGKGSYGLWQIYLHAHPEYEGIDLFDPQLNANAAFEIFRDGGNSFRAWSTFQNGAYQSHVTAATNQVNA